MTVLLPGEAISDEPRRSDRGLVLGIETSCDETAVAVVDNGTTVLSSVVSSQVDLHAVFGGVVPEIASRAHVELIIPVLHEALSGAGLDHHGHSISGGPAIGAVAATIGPGLVGALLVGVSAAKSLALAWDVPFVGVNHLEGHLYAAMIEDRDLELPNVVLLVSGGHTLLVLMAGPGNYRILGSTVDDAAGEAFDKVARYLGLGYPGGPAIERAALDGDAEAVAFTRPMLNEGLSFSFSGLKTAVVQYVRAHPEVRNEDIAASFQAAVVDLLVHKTVAAAESTGARGICLAGGVSANTALREAISSKAAERGLAVYLPSRHMCTDNAAMIAAAGYFRLESDGPTPLSMGANASLRFPESA